MIEQTWYVLRNPKSFLVESTVAEISVSGTVSKQTDQTSDKFNPLSPIVCLIRHIKLRLCVLNCIKITPVCAELHKNYAWSHR